MRLHFNGTEETGMKLAERIHGKAVIGHDGKNIYVEIPDDEQTMKYVGALRAEWK